MYKTYAYLVLSEEISTGQKSLKIWSNIPQNTAYFISNNRVNSVMFEHCVQHKTHGNHFHEARLHLLCEIAMAGESSSFWWDVYKYLMKQDCENCHNGYHCDLHVFSDENFKKFMGGK